MKDGIAWAGGGLGGRDGVPHRFTAVLRSWSRRAAGLEATRVAGGYGGVDREVLVAATR